MTKGPVPSDVAGRCIRLLRPHPWTRWKENELVMTSLSTKEKVSSWPVQVRTCTRCGLTETRDL